MRSPAVLTRPRAGAQGSQTSGIPPSFIVGRDDHLDWLSTLGILTLGHARVVVVPGWCWDLGCQACDLCDLCEARDFCAELAVAPRGRTYSRFWPTTLDRAHHHRVRTFYRVRDALVRSITTAVATRAPFQHAAMAVCSTSRHGFLRRVEARRAGT